MIELMIVVAIIGLLASIAYPNYRDYITRGKITEATSGLSDGRIKMEQFFQDNRTYVGGPTPTASSSFAFSTSSLTASTYTLVASATGAIAGFVYTIDQNNNKVTTAAPTTPPSMAWGGTYPVNCWVTKRGGGC